MASENFHNDPYALMNGDNPGTSLTLTPFNGSSFLSWSRTVKMALGAKLKLGFINGTLKKPYEDDVNHQRWIRCDYMVTCWILNSMTSEVSSAFVYSKSAYDLWRDVVERYGQSNGPLLYQLKRDLDEVKQNDDSVVVYYNKLKRYWDELESLIDVPTCECGKMQECTCKIGDRYREIEEQSRLMQFLMKLNGEYEGMKSQLLTMDPLPTVNRAFYLVQQVEKQKFITHHTHETSAFLAKAGNNQGQYGRSGSYGRGYENKMVDNRKFYEGRSSNDWREGRKLFCSYCKQNGHTYEGCFERIGYPDWYKGKKGKKNQNLRLAANVNSSGLDTPLEVEDSDQSIKSPDGVHPDLIAAVCQQVVKVFQAQGGGIPGNMLGYAGNQH